MWTLILGIIKALLGIFTKKDERDIAEQTGEKLGHGEDAAKSLDAAEQAQDARNRVAVDLGTHPDVVRSHDSFERPD